MFKVMINGELRTSAKDMRLMDFLRDELHLTGTKDGCSAGACGACTVIIDGKKVKACIFKLSQLVGKNVITIEGLSPREKEVFAYTFAHCGAVQCGFCIPGMVMSAKALIDENPNPTAQEVKMALVGNICRCTGYVKIEEAILEAAKFLREGTPVPAVDYEAHVGKHLPRVDAIEKTLGTGVYVDDIHIDGMIYAKRVRINSPRALINKIDASKALAHPACVGVFTAKDVPFNKTGHIIPDWDVLIPEGEATRYVGDGVALVAVSEKDKLDEVAKLVEVDYTELPPILNPRDGLKEDAPKLHPNGNILAFKELHRGNADEAIAKSAYVVTNTYTTPQTDHAFMEPECAIAVPDGNDKLIMYTGSQSVYDEVHEISRMLQIPEENLHIKSQLVGGGFGGKEDMSVQHHAALVAWLTKKPCKVLFTRQDSLDIHVKRHAMEIEITTACDAEGNLTATKVKILSDCGAYASLGGPVLERACTHAAGPYHFENFDAEGTCVYTNNVPGGAFRGFGVTQSCFAQEVNIDLLAEKAGIDPWEFRYKNCIRPGESLPNGQIAGPETGVAECLEAVKPYYDASPDAGIAICMKNSGIGVGLPDIGRCNLEVKDGKVHILTSAACIGQGVGTVAVQIVCEVTGLPADLCIMENPDSKRTPNSGTTTASRQTVFTGEATREAAKLLAAALKVKTLAELEGKLFCGEFSGITDKMGSDKPHPVSHVAYSYGACVALLDEQNKVGSLNFAFDVGRVVNPRACEGQVEGGAIMGMGYALTEDFKQPNGLVNTKYGTLGLLRSNQCPPMTIKFIEKGTEDQYAYGAKGIGEISSIPSAPALANAYRRRDGILRRDLPLRPTPYKK